jgi:hypothetical protein
VGPYRARGRPIERRGRRQTRLRAVVSSQTRLRAVVSSSKEAAISEWLFGFQASGDEAVHELKPLVIDLASSGAQAQAYDFILCQH